MSFLPNVGSRVRMWNGRKGTVTQVSPEGDNDRVRFDGDVGDQRINAWQIKQVLHEATP